VRIEKIIIAEHHGFCMGVKRAINIAEDTKAAGVENVTILKEIVHNNAVVERFRREGIDQKFEVGGIDGGTLIISAHGVAPDVIQEAKDKGLNVIDATCPLVTRIHDIVDKLVEKGYYILHFGDDHHDETMGVLGHAPDKMRVVTSIEDLMSIPDEMPEKLALTTQTTAGGPEFAEAEKKAVERWPRIKVFNTICNATTQRQSAVINLAPNVDVMLVVGSRTSANSLRLWSMSEALCGRAHLIDSDADLHEEWLLGSDDAPVRTVGITAGASTPEFLVDAVVERLVEFSGGSAEVVRPVKRRQANRLALADDDCH